jgi:hypothetical protein
MPKNTVTDPITDQEMAFAHLILTGTMNDRRAAEAVGLNPDTASYTKAKPRVRDYMFEHRAAVSQKLVEQEADGLRKLNIGRDQILTRLWELATLSQEATRGSIAGQIKALSMILAIEGLIPGRHTPSGTQPAAPPAEGQTYTAPRLREQQNEPAGGDPTGHKAATAAQPAAPQATKPEPASRPAPKPANDMSFPNLEMNPQGALNPFLKSVSSNSLPGATSYAFDAVLDRACSLRLPASQAIDFSRRRR